jgi:hypothetical protein
MTVSAFSAPFANAGLYNPWSLSSQIPQGLGINPYAFQQYQQNQPLASAPLGSVGGPIHALQQLHQTLPLLQAVPQQVQRLQQLVSMQLQELQPLQQIVHVLPAQLQQLQQLITFASQQQAFGPGAALGGFTFAAPWGTSPQAFGTQPSQVM